MQIVAASHLDHGLTEAQINHVRERFAGRDSFFIESFELPEGLGLCPSGLYGPAAGDAPVEESAVHYAQRGDRPGESRMVAKAARLQRTVTVIAGPYKNEETGEEFACVLYTAHGGPQAPREPFDSNLTPEQKEQSEAFWAEHALAAQ